MKKKTADRKRGRKWSDICLILWHVDLMEPTAEEAHKPTRPHKTKKKESEKLKEIECERQAEVSKEGLKVSDL